MPKILHANASLIDGVKIALDNGRAHALITDQSSEINPGLGPTPLELCVMSHAGCYVTVCAKSAQKMRLPLKGCEVKVEAVKAEEVSTIIEETLDITLDIDAPADRIQRLHEVTIKNCPVGVMFEKAGVKIKYNIKIKEKSKE